MGRDIRSAVGRRQGQGIYKEWEHPPYPLVALVQTDGMIPRSQGPRQGRFRQSVVEDNHIPRAGCYVPDGSKDFLFWYVLYKAVRSFYRRQVEMGI